MNLEKIALMALLGQAAHQLTSFAQHQAKHPEVQAICASLVTAINGAIQGLASDPS